MSLRTKILLYLVMVHVAMGAIALLILIEKPWMLLVFELLFLISILMGYFLVRSLFVPLEMIRTGGELIRERDFGTRFTEVGHSEMDQLIRIYNSMIEQLRDERLRSEEANLFMDRLLAASPSGVITLDHDRRIAMLNPAAEKILALSSAEIVGQPLAALDTPLFADLDAIEPGASRVVGLAGRRRLRCRRAQFLDRGFSRDFFLLEELTEELRASEKAAYEKLIRLISHEVNNSVGSVRSLLQSCLNYSDQIRGEDRDDYRTAHEVAIARMENLGGFVNAFADVVRIPEPQRTRCDVEALLRDLARLLEPELAERRIEIVFERREEWLPIELDKNQIEQALLNVYRNAIEAIGEGGTLTVVLDRRKDRPQLRILDTGPGIPEANADELFTPFFSTKRDGRGLGLTLIQEVLTQHGLEFGLDNRPEGGAEFWIEF